ncbi:hypothetical protein A2276_04255 [candidate division WOR-1 bacterium RIFOXYA12_FULL_43_27]|uniref:Flagellar assembly protein FliH/Type III secretion system HrpE domain-containing protein n=1 Tax=candidate division WOR-1 bacterium RIFOXYC2_FULL_46_14 TaxID=1802587 RepID=A0A1F4U312_UNCSA|nr:MAG: hypothetical protein A2276_04255 [candidate division WOR-1 bacterium RIFOXYA12_FULL_43_27]OGC19097.1 MAG: hypothetical protein A2292_00080 [candidate division WOR-1 bacterium RIFOXYB2_FULL_46_45]OGC30085.1 MAG: hypothetical protein A2232_00080 [candidate division WOR-1 bacterium RIFOXYA2_FULL_46_56]OGC39326.1 MAG: hypothetical protein A2438_00080 [candidate division WOR-1 bacterium RIFOXYC2_FULL_46_14]
MGLIKKSQIKESGEVFLEKQSFPAPEPVIEEEVPLSTYGNNEEMPAEDATYRARREAETIKQEAKRSGYEEGKRQGQAEIQQKMKEALETLNDAIKARKKIIKDAEAEILRLALKSAEQIIRSEVSLHRDVCLNIVSEAISRVSDREQVIVRVNREDAEYIKKYKDRLSGIVDGIRSFSILEDNQIEPGGCIVETNLGYIDARINTKIESIEDAFRKLSESEEEK